MARQSNPPVEFYGDPISATVGIGGDRFSLYDPNGFNPTGFGPTAMTNVPYALPSVPPTYGDTGIGGPNPAALAASNAPFSLTSSPLPWAILFILGALFAFHHIAWKD